MYTHLKLFRFNNSNTPQNLCNDLGISILWRQKIPKDDNFKLGTIWTDFGLCCTVTLNYDSNNEITKPRAGKVIIHKLLGEVSLKSVNSNFTLAIHSPKL